ncbi:Hypothetical predicted protein [Lecanosticta acicola]|uniref:Defect at low temperature protein 1 n=1 Tax=Lecanosticta acicola TaxID=111012 RepID=A0AAI8YSD2_9PEZI|nr:Hypothetical predicted protein [Lecanosticta acicola]
MDHILLRRLLGLLLLALISLVCSIGFLATSSPTSETRPVYIAWTTVSGAVVYIALMLCFLTWLQFRDKWNGSQEAFDPVYKCDARSSGEISEDEKKAAAGGGDSSTSTFYWCDEDFRAQVEGTLPRTPETVHHHHHHYFPQRDGTRLSSIPELPPSSPSVSLDSSRAYTLDLRVPPTPPRSPSPAYFMGLRVPSPSTPPRSPSPISYTLDLRLPPPPAAAHHNPIDPAPPTMRNNALRDIQIASPGLKLGVNPRDPYGLSILPRQLSFQNTGGVGGAAFEGSVFQGMGKAKEVDDGVSPKKQDGVPEKEVLKEEMRKKVQAMRAALLAGDEEEEEDG